MLELIGFCFSNPLAIFMNCRKRHTREWTPTRLRAAALLLLTILGLHARDFANVAATMA